LGLAKPNQYSQSARKQISSWSWDDNFGPKSPNLHDPYLLTVRSTVVKNIQKAQKRYKLQYDHKPTSLNLQLGNWALVHFPAEESGKKHKLLRPWHVLYCVTAVNNPDVTVAKVYFPQGKQITIHQSRFKYHPAAFPAIGMAASRRD